jgi:hypothetical protein
MFIQNVKNSIAPKVVVPYVGSEKVEHGHFPTTFFWRGKPNDELWTEVVDEFCSSPVKTILRPRVCSFKQIAAAKKKKNKSNRS